MTDLATLGIAVDSRPVKEANDNLRTFQTVARGAGSSADAYGQSADKAARATDKLAQSANGSLRVMSLLRTGLAAVGAAFTVKAIVDMADGWSDLTSRVNLAAGSIEKGSAVMSRLSEIARRTYSSIAQTTESYIANASIMRELGYSTKQTLDFTAALNNALVVSGAKGQQAASVQNALAKAMALGKLSGDNLNTVIASGGRLTELLAERFKTTTGGLLQFGQKGKITGDIIADVLLKNLEKLNKEADSMPATIGDAFTLIGNSILRTIGVFDQASKISETFAEKIIFVADHMERFIATGLAAVGVWGTQYVLSMTAAATATLRLEKALIILRGAIARTGVGVLIVILGDLIYRIYEAIRTTESWGDAFSKFGESMKLVWQGVKLSFFAGLDAMKSAWSSFLSFFLQSIQGIGSIFGAVFNFDDAISNLKKDSKDFAANAAEQFQSAIENFSKSYAVLQESGGNIDLSGDAGVAKKLEQTSKAAERAKKAYDNLLLSAKQTVAQQKLEAETAGLTGIAQETLRFKLDLLQKAEEKRLNLSPKMKQALLDQVDAFEKYATAAAKATLQQDLLFERAQIGRTEIERTIASTLRGAGLEVNFNSVEAGMIRMNEQLKITDDAWKNFGSGVEDVLDKIVDGSADWKDILKSLIPVMKDLILELIRAQSIGQGGGGSSGLGGVFSSLFGGLFGGKSSDPWSGLRLAGGGLVSGPGSGTSDSIPAKLSNGEFVVNATATKLFRPLLEAINDNKPLALARGGYVGALNAAGSNVIPMPSPSSIPTEPGRGGGNSQDVNVTTDVKISFDKEGNPLAAVDSRIDQKIATNNKMRDRSAAVRMAPTLRQVNQRGYAK